MTFPALSLTILIFMFLLLYTGAFKVSGDRLRTLHAQRAKVPVGIDKHSHVGDQRASRVYRTGVLQRECEDFVVGDPTAAVHPIECRVSILSNRWKCCHL